MNMESGLPAGSLIICSRNRPRLLFETVESVLRGSQLPNEMVIVDQSAEPNPDLLEMKTEHPCEVRYLHSKTAGVSAGRNLGIASSRYDVLIFIDDDMFVASDWYGSLMRAVVHAGRSGVVTGRVLPGESESSNHTSPSIKADQEPAVYQGRIGRDVLYSGNMGAYRSVFDAVGVFDERLGPGAAFPSAEDNDLGFRLLERGYRICYAPEAVVFHRAWRSKGEILSLEWRYGMGQGAFYAKHMNRRDSHMSSRMAHDIGGNLKHFWGHLRRRRRLRLDYLFQAFGLLYGAVRWRTAQIGRGSP
ncbi:MAG: hypothetical protein DPW18_08210 [Chloroflexi bacterium]|nr:hypothetical protein [Chloroflexota bacterium]MDL1942884.1 glycosyltransferase [Chloroflexi bacterium CFX2]